MDVAKERLVYLYFPTKDQKDHITDIAEKKGTTVTKLIIEIINNSLEKDTIDDGFITKAEMQKELDKISTENKELHRELKMRDNLVNNLEKELRSYRIKPFLEEEFTGSRKFDQELISLLKKHGEIRKEILLQLLDVDPMDIDVIKGINRQMDTLERYGLVKDIGGKWRWKP
jgi:hypothetical protein